MNQITLDKIKNFSNITPSMQLSFRKIVEDWSPELPPLTILFSGLGNSFIDNFESLSNKQRRMVFEAIEAMLKGKDEELNIGASTGFLEAIAVKPSFSRMTKEMLGEESCSFLKAWNQFMGIQDNDL